MNHEAAKTFADEVEKDLKENGHAYDVKTYRAKCETIVEMRHPKMNVMKQARLIATMMDARFPVKKGDS